MKTKRYIVLAVLLAVLMALSGCGMKSSHVKAIKDAIVEYSDYYLEVDSLGGQIRKQARGLTGYEDAASYMLDIRVPDYSLIDINEVRYEAPAIDYANANYDAYLQEVREAIRRSVEAYALSAKLDGYIDTQLSVNLRQDNGQWTAAIDTASRNSLRDLVEGMMAEKAAELNELPKECDYVRVAEQKDALLGAVIGESAYLDSVAVTGVDDLGGGQYRLSISYPDPAAAFTALGDEFVSSYHERVFGSIACTLDPNGYSSLAVPVAMKSGSVTVSMDGSGSCSLVDGQALGDEYTVALENAQAAAEAAVNEKWAVPEVAKPTSNTLLYGNSSGDAEFRFTLSSATPDTYIRLFKTSGEDDPGKLQAGMYLRSNGRQFKVSVPPGLYRVVVAWGSTWYGPEYMFGPDGNYMIYYELHSVESGYFANGDFSMRWDLNSYFEPYDYDVDITA